MSAASLDQPGSCSAMLSNWSPSGLVTLTPPTPTVPSLFFLSHLFFPLLLPVWVQCPGSDFCPAPLGSLYVLSVSLSLQGTVLKAFAARKISLTSKYAAHMNLYWGGGGGAQWVLTADGGAGAAQAAVGWGIWDM